MRTLEQLRDWHKAKSDTKYLNNEEYRVHDDAIALLDAHLTSREAKGDAFSPIPEAVDAPTPELWRAYEAFNATYLGYNTQQALRAAINGVLAERAAQEAAKPVVPMEVASIRGVDEYGPMIDWTRHWTELPAGTKLYIKEPTP